MAKNVKELVVWQRGMELVRDVYSICGKLPSGEQLALSSQMRRAAISIPSNIAEGYRRNGSKEFRQFCHIALGSASELETQLIITNQIYTQIDTEKLYKNASKCKKC